MTGKFEVDQHLPPLIDHHLLAEAITGRTVLRYQEVGRPQAIIQDLVVAALREVEAAVAVPIAVEATS